MVRAAHVALIGVLGTSFVAPHIVYAQQSSHATTDASGAKAVLARAVAKYKSAHTLRVRFQQHLTNTFTGTSSDATGELLRQAPNLFAINFISPSSDRIVCDGTSLWLYLPSSAPDQVIKMPVSGENMIFVDPLDQILSASTDQYTVTDAGVTTLNSHATHAVTLVSRGGAALFTKATIWIDDTDSSVRQIDTSEPTGVQRHIVITQFSAGEPLPRSAFTFTPPPNVRVIDQRTLTGR